jgi:CRP/FNR family cyclic AMP-dependent transcriptional regulator
MVLFRGVPAQELERLAPLLHERGFPAGATVMTAEQPGEAVYVLLSSSVKVHLFTPDGAEVILAALGPGEVVGEMSLADSLGRSASVSTSFSRNRKRKPASVSDIQPSSPWS